MTIEDIQQILEDLYVSRINLASILFSPENYASVAFCDAVTIWSYLFLMQNNSVELRDAEQISQVVSGMKHYSERITSFKNHRVHYNSHGLHSKFSLVDIPLTLKETPETILVTWNTSLRRKYKFGFHYIGNDTREQNPDLKGDKAGQELIHAFSALLLGCFKPDDTSDAESAMMYLRWLLSECNSLHAIELYLSRAHPDYKAFLFDYAVAHCPALQPQLELAI